MNFKKLLKIITQSCMGKFINGRIKDDNRNIAEGLRCLAENPFFVLIKNKKRLQAGSEQMNKLC